MALPVRPPTVANVVGGGSDWCVVGTGAVFVDQKDR